MTLAHLQMLDLWIEQGEVRQVTSEVLHQLRFCGQLVGAPKEIFDDVSSTNFIEKVLLVRQMRKSASKDFGTALLSSREHEDIGDIRSAIVVFEEFIAASPAEGFKNIAKSEIARLSHLLG